METGRLCVQICGQVIPKTVKMRPPCLTVRDKGVGLEGPGPGLGRMVVFLAPAQFFLFLHRCRFLEIRGWILMMHLSSSSSGVPVMTRSSAAALGFSPISLQALICLVFLHLTNIHTLTFPDTHATPSLCALLLWLFKPK